jgi:hypothetical protein
MRHNNNGPSYGVQNILQNLTRFHQDFRLVIHQQYIWAFNAGHSNSVAGRPTVQKVLTSVFPKALPV